MRFCVLLALLVATFVASCTSFTSAENNALGGITNNNINARHLREYDDDSDEERGPPLNAAVSRTASAAKTAKLAANANEAAKSSTFKKVIAWMAAAFGFTSLGAFLTYYYNRVKKSNVVSTAKTSTGSGTA